MITASILATTHGLKPRRSMMIGFGIPISFVTLAFLVFCVSFFFFYRYEYYSTLYKIRESCLVQKNNLFVCFHRFCSFVK
jgi:hypothetical protein